MTLVMFEVRGNVWAKKKKKQIDNDLAVPHPLILVILRLADSSLFLAAKIGELYRFVVFEPRDKVVGTSF